MKEQDREWGYEPAKAGMAVEAKMGMAVIVILVCAFGFLVYHKFDLKQRQLLARVKGPETQNTASVMLKNSAGAAANSMLSEETAFVADRPLLNATPASSSTVLQDVAGSRNTFELSEPAIELSEPATETVSVDDRFAAAAFRTEVRGESLAAEPSFDQLMQENSPLPPTSTAAAASGLAADSLPPGPGETNTDFPNPASSALAAETSVSHDPFAAAMAETEPADRQPFFPQDDNRPPSHPTPPSAHSDADAFDREVVASPVAPSAAEFPDFSATTLPVATSVAEAGPAPAFDAPAASAPNMLPPVTEIASVDRPSVADVPAFDLTEPTPQPTRVSSAESSTADEPAQSNEVNAFAGALVADFGEFPARDSSTEVSIAAPGAALIGPEETLLAMADPPPENKFATDGDGFVRSRRSTAANQATAFDDVRADSAQQTSDATSGQDSQGSAFADFDNQSTLRASEKPEHISNRRSAEVPSVDSRFAQAQNGHRTFGGPGSTRETVSAQMSGSTHGAGTSAKSSPFAVATATSSTTAPIRQVSIASDPCEVCEVQPNDTYWTISKRMYGTAIYFSSLALYNQHRIPDPKKLRPGMKVLVPPPEILQERFPEFFEDLQPTTRQATGYFLQADGRPAYRVGERETLSEISQKHLGRASRWIEIYRQNQDVLKDPNHLKPGIVLVLPDDATNVHLVP
ncbi:MAG: LysM peptidoglycan-binding domain-containing protein [Planctomycetaceae bacterium]|nr:LysM peptidoglycan-binding domain-containing protein [Planctomycetaceae bacterium]